MIAAVSSFIFLLSAFFDWHRAAELHRVLSFTRAPCQLRTPARYGHARGARTLDLRVMNPPLCLAELSRDGGAPCRCCPGTPRVQAACAAGYARAASRRGTSTAGSRSSRVPSALLVAVRCCVSQRWSARRELHPHTLAGPSSSGWCGCYFATSRCGAPGWFCPSDLRRVVPALFWLSYAGVASQAGLAPAASRFEGGRSVG